MPKVVEKEEETTKIEHAEDKESENIEDEEVRHDNHYDSHMKHDHEHHDHHHHEERPKESPSSIPSIPSMDQDVQIESDGLEIMPPVETLVQETETATNPTRQTEAEIREDRIKDWSPKQPDSPRPSTTSDLDKNTSEVERPRHEETPIKLVLSSSIGSSGGQKYCADLNQIKNIFDKHIEPIYMPLIHLLPSEFQLLLLDETGFAGLTRASCLFVSLVLALVMSVWFVLSRANETKKMSLKHKMN